MRLTEMLEAPDSYTHCQITKFDELEDGTLLVRGKPTEEIVDLDDQIADKAWFNKALPEWFNWGNIREMHRPSAVGVGKELEFDENDQPYLTSHVIDKDAIQKVKAGVYKAYSIGVKNPTIKRDSQAKKGRIVGGRIVEVSLVDYPAVPTAKFDIVKAASPDRPLTPTYQYNLLRGIAEAAGGGWYDAQRNTIIEEINKRIGKPASTPDKKEPTEVKPNQPQAPVSVAPTALKPNAMRGDPKMEPGQKEPQHSTREEVTERNAWEANAGDSADQPPLGPEGVQAQIIREEHDAVVIQVGNRVYRIPILYDNDQPYWGTPELQGTLSEPGDPGEFTPLVPEGAKSGAKEGEQLEGKNATPTVTKGVSMPTFSPDVVKAVAAAALEQGGTIYCPHCVTEVQCEAYGEPNQLPDGSFSQLMKCQAGHFVPRFVYKGVIEKSLGITLGKRAKPEEGEAEDKKKGEKGEKAAEGENAPGAGLAPGMGAGEKKAEPNEAGEKKAEPYKGEMPDEGKAKDGKPGKKDGKEDGKPGEKDDKKPPFLKEGMPDEGKGVKGPIQSMTMGVGDKVCDPVGDPPKVDPKYSEIVKSLVQDGVAAALMELGISPDTLRKSAAKNRVTRIKDALTKGLEVAGRMEEALEKGVNAGGPSNGVGNRSGVEEEFREVAGELAGLAGLIRRGEEKLDGGKGADNPGHVEFGIPERNGFPDTHWDNQRFTSAGEGGRNDGGAGAFVPPKGATPDIQKGIVAADDLKSVVGDLVKSVAAELVGEVKTAFSSLHEEIEALKHVAEQPRHVDPNANVAARTSPFGRTEDEGVTKRANQIRETLEHLPQADQDALAPLLIQMARERGPVRMSR